MIIRNTGNTGGIYPDRGDSSVRSGRSGKNGGNNIPRMPDTSNAAEIADISQLKSKSAANTFETISVNSKTAQNISNNMSGSAHPAAEDIKRTVAGAVNNRRHDKNRVAEYLSVRKYYMLAMSFIYIIGVVLGSVLIKNIDKKDIVNLCSVMDSFFTGISSINMTARILSNIVLNMIFIFGIYICGITVFAPLICSAFCLYKGLTSGFITGVYIIGGATKFHLAVCAVTFVLYLFIMLFFILTCGESMSFSSFLFKNEESFKDSLSFKNVSVYSSRFLLFLALISLSTVVQTLTIPVVYSILG